ncbi:MAG: hypothetical protein ABC596_05840 [Candidatus Methanosuratincola petrocarbonis]
MPEVDQLTLLLANALAGAIAVPLLQVLKHYLRISGTPMCWVTMLVALIIGGLACLLTGEVSFAELLHDPLLLFGSGGIVAAMATAIYRTLKEKLGLGS